MENKKTNKTNKTSTKKTTKGNTKNKTTPKKVLNKNKNTQNKKTKGSLKKGWKNMSKIKKAIIIFVLIMLLLMMIGIAVFAGIFFSDKFAITKEDLLINYANTIVYDSEGNVIAELSGDESRKIITLSDMSEYLPKAFVAIEDERFYKHQGVDVKRTAAATVTYVFNGGSSSFGGSTITQQLVKNITNEKETSGTAGIERKIKEMSRAYQIEKMISKDQILELYLNLIPLGASGKDLCGVEIASNYYFNKSAKELTIEECAFLAGINHSPNKYNPFKGLDNADMIKSRTKTVLVKMKELNYINAEQYNQAVQNVDNGLPFVQGGLPSSTVTSYYLSAAINEIVDQLVEEKGWSREYARSRVYGGGYKIYTNQITSIQNITEAEFKLEKYILKSKQVEGAHSQAAMVIIDNATGKVVACMGGLGTDVDAVGINRIYSERQPGSSIKPLGVYGAGIQYGTITAATVYDNSRTTFGTSYSPNNASSQRSGLCNIRGAIEVSANIVACKVLSGVDPDKSIDFMRELGITSLIKASEDSAHNDSNLSLALGGITKGISPLEMASAYATIANNGIYNSPTFYSKVEDENGNVILESKQESRRVMSEDVAYMIKSLLKEPVNGGMGTARNCAISGFYVGAKTGTTNDNYDRWLCGMTEYYTGAVWYGYDKNEKINYSANPAALIWAGVMKQVHSNLPAKTLQRTSNIVNATICRDTGCLATDKCTNIYSEEFIAGTVPTQCPGHESYLVCDESGKLSTEFCPHTHSVTQKPMPEKEATATWHTNSGGKYLVITETCTLHTQPAQPTTTPTPSVEDTDIMVPDVKGKTKAEAESLLKGLGFKVDFSTSTDTTKPNDTVIEQNKKPGSVVSKGATIKLVINKNTNTDNNNTNKPDNNSGGTQDSNTGNNEQKPEPDNKTPETGN